MFGKAIKSLKGVLHDVKDSVKETVNTVSNTTQNTFVINGKNYYEEKLLGEGGYGYVYEVSDNGEYKFIVYNRHGSIKEQSIIVNNINRSNPEGKCSGWYQNGVSNISIDANDDIGIGKYVSDTHKKKVEVFNWE